jgi:type IV pilus assembly protein PilQ
MIKTLKFKDADIRVVLQAIIQKAMINEEKVNVLISPEVKGLVTIDLVNVAWQTALDGILRANNYGYEWIGRNLILVDTLEGLAEKRKQSTDAMQQEPLETVAYQLKYLDAHEVKKLLDGQISPRGKITIFESELQKGWNVTGGISGDFTKAERIAGARNRSKTLVITDTQSNLRNIIKAVEKIDIMPQQILIEARIMEVNRDRLKDIGVDWGSGNSVSSGTLTNLTVTKDGNTIESTGGILNAISQEAPSIFTPKAASIDKTWPYGTGLSLAYQKLTGKQFQILIHALEEDVHTNTLSAPRIITLDGQEAYLMVGQKRPIIASTVTPGNASQGTSDTITKNLSADKGDIKGGYLPLGISLNVVPQVCDGDYINMSIYPSVTSSNEDTPATSLIGTITSTDNYPVVDVRELQTQVLMKSGETIAIGGLLKDVKGKSYFKVPILGSIPFLGALFRRETDNVEKIDLVIFISAQVIKQGEFPSEDAFNTRKLEWSKKPKK